MGTENDMGLHMGDNRDIAKIMSEKNGVVYEFYAPRPKLETIDNWANDLTLFTGNKTLQKGPNTWYFSYPENKKFNKLLEMGNPQISASGYPGWQNYTLTKDVTVSNKELNWPNMPKKAEVELNKLRNEYDKLEPNKYMRKPPEISTKLSDINSRAAKVLYDNGIDVVKYMNGNPGEKAGYSYFLTNPKVIYQPKDFNIKGKHLLIPSIGAGVLTSNDN